MLFISRKQCLSMCHAFHIYTIHDLNEVSEDIPKPTNNTKELSTFILGTGSARVKGPDQLRTLAEQQQ